MNAEEAREIVASVEDDEGKPRLDAMVREIRYQYAKGYLAALEGPEVKALAEAAIKAYPEVAGDRAAKALKKAIDAYRKAMKP